MSYAPNVKKALGVASGKGEKYVNLSCWGGCAGVHGVLFSESQVVGRLQNTMSSVFLPGFSHVPPPLTMAGSYEFSCTTVGLRRLFMNWHDHELRIQKPQNMKPGFYNSNESNLFLITHYIK